MKCDDQYREEPTMMTISASDEENYRKLTKVWLIWLSLWFFFFVFIQKRAKAKCSKIFLANFNQPIICYLFKAERRKRRRATPKYRNLHATRERYAILC